MSATDRNGNPLLRMSQVTAASDAAQRIAEHARALVDVAEWLVRAGMSDEYYALSDLRTKLAVLAGGLDTRVRDTYVAARRGEELLK